MDECCRQILTENVAGVITCPLCGASWYTYHGQWFAINNPHNKRETVHRKGTGNSDHNYGEQGCFKKVRPVYDKRFCRDCRRCERLCPQKAVRLFSGTLTIDASRCNNCRKCIIHCMGGALK
ncbi:MAG: 4Fe-4S dicluster domain-containing protein [Bacteroidota bacterium]